ncbi:MAG TPA: DUF6036 family nucleotidyltransferase [Solirubrobacteraceae bacterium]|nr:DUF6036 family nucleotidyltransferase [Solirubrobacteraceae bacterium]
MENIGSDQLEIILTAMNDQLAVADASVHLVVIGGSGLIAIEAATRATRDVDVVALEEEGELISADPLPQTVRDAAAVVARDFGLRPDWLNAGPTGLLLHGLPVGFADRLTSRDFGQALRVSFASRIDQVFLKLYAAADRREPRDFADLRLLKPTDEELRAAARWARTHNMPGPFDDAMARALADLGVEDEGRGA